MLSYPQQIELLNLKERIIGNPTLRKRLIDLHGQSKGWQEFAQELGADYTVVRNLKDMAICELSYSTRDFTAMRAEVYNEEKEDMLRHPKRKALIILNSPNATVEITIASRKPVTVVSARKAAQVTVIANKKKMRETIQISHDTNLPIYIFGNVEELQCTGQRLSECYLVNCPHLSNLDLRVNQLKHVRLCQKMPKLRNINLATNCLQPECLPKMLPHLCQLEQDGLFDTDPEIITDAQITGDIRWQAKQIGWIIKNV